MKNLLFVAIAIFVLTAVGCAPSPNYRQNPTYNYPSRGYDGTMYGAEVQQEWAQAEQQFARAETSRARAARDWQRAEYEQDLAKARAAREYSRAARDLARTYKDIRQAVTGDYWWK